MTNKRHKYQKKDSLYKKPESQGHKTLFSAEAIGDDPNKDDDNELAEYKLTPEAQADKFISLWAKYVRPMKKYKGFRQLVEKEGADMAYSSVKMMYKYYVIKNNWKEEKFKFVVDKILENSSVLSHAGFKRYEYLYEHGKEKSYGRNSGTTSSIYEDENEQAKIEDVLDAWEKLENM